MTVTEIVKGLLDPNRRLSDAVQNNPWSQDDYEKAWLVIQLVEERNQDMLDHGSLNRGEKLTQAAIATLGISPTDYAELERRVREWDRDVNKT